MPCALQAHAGHRRQLEEHSERHRLQLAEAQQRLQEQLADLRQRAQDQAAEADSHLRSVEHAAFEQRGIQEHRLKDLEAAMEAQKAAHEKAVSKMAAQQARKVLLMTLMRQPMMGYDGLLITGLMSYQ